MGYLGQHGKVYTHDESKDIQDIYKREAVKQFQKIYDKFNIMKTDTEDLYWGDEIEHSIMNFNDQKKEVKLQPNTQYIFDEMNKRNSDFNSLSKEEQDKHSMDYFNIGLEYGAYMLETTPIHPYSTQFNMNQARQNLMRRRDMLNEICKDGDVAMWISTHPMLGMEKTYIDYKIMNFEDNDDQQTLQLKQQLHSNHFGQSQQGFQDKLITNHSRFRYLTMNVRLRRGSNPRIAMDIFQDVNTKQKELIVDHFGYGMSNCCLQQTFSTLNIHNCRHVYDQLNILTPIMMAFTASTPYLAGKLLDSDCRWFIISQAVDCRNKEERDPDSEIYLPKSRFDSITYYIGNSDMFRPEYNDIKFKANFEPVIKFRKDSFKDGLQLDYNLQQHLAFLLARDALCIFDQKVKDKNFDDSFEQLNSTNWNTVRFKPQPDINADMPWRIEFRPLELQPTVTENVQTLFLVKVFAHMVISHNYLINFYVPISYVDINVKRAAQRDALLSSKFYFRTNIFDKGLPVIEEMFIREYFLGTDKFIGLIKVMDQFIKTHFLDSKNQANQKEQQEEDFYKQFQELCEYVKKKITGVIPTSASFIRQFVLKHPQYEQDSNLNMQICYDLLKKLSQITKTDNYTYM